MILENSFKRRKKNYLLSYMMKNLTKQVRKGKLQILLTKVINWF